MKPTSEKLQRILDRAIDAKKIFGTSFCIEYKGNQWCGASGNLTPESLYFIASTTKLYVTALVLQLQSKGLLSLDDTISKYLDTAILNGLHLFRGKDYSSHITIRHLLAHTSGIPDYFQQKDKDGRSFESEIIAGKDQYWTFEQTIERSKSLKPVYIPGTPGKALYSDTNFQLLGKIIENITQRSIAENYATNIFSPLGLTQTYLYSDIEDGRPQILYYKSKPLWVPKAMASFGPDGGIVSTSGEMITFLRAFFQGDLFPVAYIDALKIWNPIFFPMQSGIGIHRFKLPWIFDPLRRMPEMIGHSGLSGTLAYYSPSKNLYIAGTVNQVAYPSTSFQLAIKLIQAVLKA